MSEPFVGQIAITTFDYAPRGWMLCQGQILTIQQYTALYSLIGIQFGGDGKVNFALPDLRGRIIAGSGPAKVDPSVNFVQGKSVGAEKVVLTPDNFPTHNHVVYADSTSTQVDPTNAYWGGDTTGTAALYGTPTPNVNPLVNMNATAIGTAGGNQGHENMPPFMVMNYMIALIGIYPMRD